MQDKLGERIRSVRRGAGLSQSAFGERLAISLPTVVRMERGEGQAPRLDLVQKIAEIYGCDLGWLITGERGVNGVPVMKTLEPTGDSQPVARLAVPGLAEAGVAIQITSDDFSPTVRPGDYVVISGNPTENGDLVAFSMPWGEMRLRRLLINEGQQRLVAELDGVPEIPVDTRIRVYGKVSSIVRHIKL